MPEISMELMTKWAEVLGWGAMLTALIYFAWAYARRRGGVWPHVLGWSAAANLLVFGVATAAGMISATTVGRPLSALLARVPIDYETWYLAGGIAVFLMGALTLAAGLALIIGGWREGQLRGRRRRRKAG